MDFIDELTTLGKMYHTGFGFRMEDTDVVINYGHNNYDSENDTEPDDTEISLAEILERANKTVTYKKVVLKYTDEDYWYRYPARDWYNEKSSWWKNAKFQNRLLPFMSTRNYIKIVEKFMNVEIDSRIKGSPITLEDILFASRGLAMDDTRTVCNCDGKYKIISSDNDVLVLEPFIDNFSS